MRWLHNQPRATTTARQQLDTRTHHATRAVSVQFAGMACGAVGVVAPGPHLAFPRQGRGVQLAARNLGAGDALQLRDDGELVKLPAQRPATTCDEHLPALRFGLGEYFGSGRDLSMGSSSVGGSAWHRVTLQRTVVIWVTTAVCVQPHEMSTTRFFIRPGTSRGRGTTRSVNLPNPSLPLPALLWTPHTRKRTPVNVKRTCLRSQANSGGVPPNKHASLSVHHGRVRVPARNSHELETQVSAQRLVSRHAARCSPTARTNNVPETCQTSARAWALAQTAHHVRRRRSGARDRTGPRN